MRIVYYIHSQNNLWLTVFCSNCACVEFIWVCQQFVEQLLIQVLHIFGPLATIFYLILIVYKLYETIDVFFFRLLGLYFLHRKTFIYFFKKTETTNFFVFITL